MSRNRANCGRPTSYTYQFQQRGRRVVDAHKPNHISFPQIQETNDRHTTGQPSQATQALTSEVVAPALKFQANLQLLQLLQSDAVDIVPEHAPEPMPLLCVPNTVELNHNTITPTQRTYILPSQFRFLNNLRTSLLSITSLTASSSGKTDALNATDAVQLRIAERQLGKTRR